MRGGNHLLTLYGRKTSINVQKAAWALGEAGLDFDWVGKDDRPGQITIPDYAAINPQLRVPALRDDGVILRQSNAIVRYVSRNYAFGTLFPEDTGTAGVADYWMDWQAADNWRNLVAVFWNLFRVPEDQRDDAEVAKGVAGLAKDVEYLDQQLANNRFVAGNRFTMGDIPVGAAVHRILNLPIELPAAPVVEAYYERLKGRKPFATYVLDA